MKNILNLGSGTDTYGNVRMDIIKQPNVTLVGDIEKKLPFEDNTFDEVYCRQVFEHLGNPLNVLLEMKRVCKVGGRIKIITDNGGFIFYHYNLNGNSHGDYYRYGNGMIKDDMHFMFFQPSHLRNFFTKAGLKTIKIDLVYTEKWLNWKVYLVRLILRFIIGKKLAYQNIVAEAEKCS